MKPKSNNPKASVRSVSDPVVLWSDVAGTGPIPEVEVLLRVRAKEPIAASTLGRLGELAERFATRLVATGVGSLTVATELDCDGFLWAPTRRGRPPSMHTVHLRRTALRDLYRVLAGLDPTIVDPTARLGLPAKAGPGTRALTDEEIGLVRTAALGRAHQPLRAAATIGLAEATGTTGEIPNIGWEQVDLDSGAVWLPGATPIRPRSGYLTGWGRGVLRRWHDNCPDHGPVGLVLPRRVGASRGHSAQAQTANYISGLLRSAGVQGSGVRPGSIRLWAARTVLETAGVEAAARALGIGSLDAAARALGYQWRPPL